MWALFYGAGRGGANACRYGLLLVCLCFVPQPLFAEPESGIYAQANAQMDAWLANYRCIGADGIARVRYGDLTPAATVTLNNYIQALSGLKPSHMTRDEAFSFWVNLYNSLTLQQVIRAWPVDSIRDIRPGLSGWIARGPWKAKLVDVEGRALSLDDIEHGILRTQWREPRVHFVVNCASLGCPDLPPATLKPAQLEQQLQAATLHFLAHPRAWRSTGDTLVLNSLFDWFSEDFGGSEGAVLRWLARLAERAVPPHDKVEYRYDWALNGADGADGGEGSTSAEGSGSEVECQ